MTITTKIESEKATLFVEGWLDTQASPELGKAVAEISDIKSLVFDYEKLEYI